MRQMTIRAALARFALVYFVIMTTGSLLSVLLHGRYILLVDTLAVVCSVTYICAAFSKTNERYFSRQEKPRIVLGLISVDISLQLVGAICWLVVDSDLRLISAIERAGFSVAVHACMIYVLVSVNEKYLAKASG
jgi:hypothetical protein